MYITFQVNLYPVQNNSTIGPITNLHTFSSPLIVGNYPLQDLYLPFLNKKVQHGDQFTLQGVQAYQVALAAQNNYLNVLSISETDPNAPIINGSAFSSAFSNAFGS